MIVLIWLVFGAIAGWVSSVFLSEETNGTLANISISILGAILGGSFATLSLGLDASGFSITSLLTALIGSVTLLGLMRGFTRI